MAEFTHKVSGAKVVVRDNKVMDPNLWEPTKKPAAKKAPAKSDSE